MSLHTDTASAPTPAAPIEQPNQGTVIVEEAVRIMREAIPNLATPRMTPAEKSFSEGILAKAFGVKSWAEIPTLPTEAVSKGMDELQAMVNKIRASKQSHATEGKTK